MNYMEKYNYWVENVKDVDLKAELLAMKSDNAAIENAFYKDLEFGTAGLRGIMAAGSNCLNIYTIIKATQGVADYMKKHNMTVACVTSDSRLNSQLFSDTVAQVFAANGIKCHMTKECQPTPFLSYMVRQLKCDIGINITASHNPKQYNGYKVYDSYGCQLTDDAANEITELIEKVNPFNIQLNSLDSYVASGVVEYTKPELEREFLNVVLAQNVNSAAGIKVTYTPLNGTGYKMVPAILKMVGARDIVIVPEQAQPDGNFTTCLYPNPEKPETMRLAVELAKTNNSDIVIGTDPDCDRLGVAVLHKGQYVQLSGNEVGVLLVSYILEELNAKRAIPDGAVVVKTIVTSSMTDRICKDYGVEVRDVLTGFKYIGNVIAELEEAGREDRYLFGFEESCGYLRGTYVRDKDAVVASMLVAEMCATFKVHGKTLVDQLELLYAKYGKYEHKTLSYQFDGAAGAEVKQRLLDKIRAEGFSDIGGSRVNYKLDYLTQTEFKLPKADVMKFIADNGTMLIVRPSGTEPLIKNYITVAGTPEQNAENFKLIAAQLDKIFKV